MNVKVKDEAGKLLEELSLTFKSEPDKLDEGIYHSVLVYQASKFHQGTSATKNRSAVRGGGSKPYKQKGTGRARRGTSRSPLRVGGGVVFGPSPRSMEKNINSELVKKSVLQVLSTYSKPVVAINPSSETVKTKQMAAIVNEESPECRSVFVITSDLQTSVSRAVRNLGNVVMCTPHNIQVESLRNSDAMIIDFACLNTFKELYIK